MFTTERLRELTCYYRKKTEWNSVSRLDLLIGHISSASHSYSNVMTEAKYESEKSCEVRCYCLPHESQKTPYGEQENICQMFKLQTPRRRFFTACQTQHTWMGDMVSCQLQCSADQTGSHSLRALGISYFTGLLPWSSMFCYKGHRCDCGENHGGGSCGS